MHENPADGRGGGRGGAIAASNRVLYRLVIECYPEALLAQFDSRYPDSLASLDRSLLSILEREMAFSQKHMAFNRHPPFWYRAFGCTHCYFIRTRWHHLLWVRTLELL